MDGNHSVTLSIRCAATAMVGLRRCLPVPVTRPVRETAKDLVFAADESNSGLGDEIDMARWTPSNFVPDEISQHRELACRIDRHAMALLPLGLCGWAAYLIARTRP